MTISIIVTALAGVITSMLYMNNLQSTCLSSVSPESFNLGRYLLNRIMRLAALCLITLLIAKFAGLYVLSFLAGFVVTNIIYVASQAITPILTGDRV